MNWIKDISKAHREPVFSQYGEEHYLKFIFQNVGTTNKYFVDLGAWDGVHLSNTRLFALDGWNGLLVDAKGFEGVLNRFITKDNILEIMKYCPIQFDLLSIDIDGNDYWILDKVLSAFSPRLIISEYNSEHPGSKTIKYKEDFTFPFCDYYGYTFDAGIKLANKYGYTVIFQNSNLNMYYLRNDLVPNGVTHIKQLSTYKWWGPCKEKIGEWVNV